MARVKVRPDSTQLKSSSTECTTSEAPRRTASCSRPQARHRQTVRLVTPSLKSSPQINARPLSDNGQGIETPPTPPPPPPHRILTPSHPNALLIATRGPKDIAAMRHSTQMTDDQRSRRQSRNPESSPPRYERRPPPSQSRVQASLHSGRNPGYSQQTKANVVLVSRKRHSMEELQQKHLEHRQLGGQAVRVQQAKPARATKSREAFTVSTKDSAAKYPAADAVVAKQPSHERRWPRDSVSYPPRNEGRRRRQAVDTLSREASHLHRTVGESGSPEANALFAETENGDSQLDPSPGVTGDRSSTAGWRQRPQGPTPTAALSRRKEAPPVKSEPRTFAESAKSSPAPGDGPRGSTLSELLGDDAWEPGQRGLRRATRSSSKSLAAERTEVPGARENEDGTSLVYELDATHPEVRRTSPDQDVREFVGCVALQPEHNSSPPENSTWHRLHGTSPHNHPARPPSPVSPLSPGEMAIWDASGLKTRASFIRRSLTAAHVPRRPGKHYRDSGISAIARSRIVSGAEQRASLVDAPSRRIRSSCVVSQPLASPGAFAAASRASLSSPPALQASSPLPRCRFNAKLLGCKLAPSTKKSVGRAPSRDVSNQRPASVESAAGCFPALRARCFRVSATDSEPVAHAPSRPEMSLRNGDNATIDPHLLKRSASVQSSLEHREIGESDEQRALPTVCTRHPRAFITKRPVDFMQQAVGSTEDLQQSSQTTAHATELPRDEAEGKYIPPIFRHSINAAKHGRGQTDPAHVGHWDGSYAISRQPSVSAQSSQATSTPNFSRKPSQRDYPSSRPSLVEL